MNHSCTIKIGNSIFVFACPSASWLNFVKRNYAPFIFNKPPLKVFHIVISDTFKNSSKIKSLSVEPRGNSWLINRYDFVSQSTYNFNRTILSAEKNKYAFDSWLRVFFTLCGTVNKSLLIHGAGYSDNKNIYIFPGRSGKGKSTITRILGKPGALSDELVCVFKRGNSFFAASTPFWGELKKGTGKVFDGKLKSIVFIEHGKHLSFKAVTPAKAVARILSTALFFLRGPEYLRPLLDFSYELASKVPSGILSFRKNSTKREILDAVSGREP